MRFNRSARVLGLMVLVLVCAGVSQAQSSPAGPAVTCSSTAAMIGVPYSSAVAATGFVPGLPPSFMVMTGGTLPPGLTLNMSSGAITGTPTGTGTFKFTIVATGPRGDLMARAGCGINVSTPPPPVTLMCPAVGTVTVGSSYSSALVAGGFPGPIVYSIISGSLPPGLTLDPATGIISGTPTSSGAFNFTAQAMGTDQSASATCGITTSSPCSLQAANNGNFNGTPIGGGDFIWFSSNFQASGVPSSGAQVFFQGSTIQFTAGGTPYTVNVPNAVVTFDPNASCATTSFNAVTNTWQTTVPISGSDEIFVSGVAFPVPAGGLPGGINPVSWQGTFATNTPGLSMNWKWAAAVYTSFNTDYNALAIKPTHSNACLYNNSDHAGTPEGVTPSGASVQKFVVGGAGGGGGSNFTGSWSGTLSVKPLCH